MKLFLLLTVTLFSLQAKTFTVANYNLQNLFDLEKSGTEYIDYIPFTKAQWNRKTYTIKLNNLSKAIHEMDADIIALQEVESPQALRDLQTTLKRLGSHYNYHVISTKKITTVRNAVLSKFPITSHQEILVDPNDGIRSILDLTVNVDGHPLQLFVNHWKSKRGPESKRVAYAKALEKIVKKIHPKDDYLIIGDLNSNYNELYSFKKNQKHNDTNGVTGINHFLHTVNGKKINDFTFFKKADSKFHYDLWMELPSKKRWSYLFKGRNSTLDHIIIPKSLIDNHGINYKPNSFKRFMPPYLAKGRKIFRWKFSRKGGFKHHLGEGYSDHLPIIATFSY